MGIFNSAWEWFTRQVGADGTITLDACIEKLQAEAYFKRLAMQCCINLIADTISLAEFQTYVDKKNKKGDNYYLFNVEPNVNRSASAFWRYVIRRLVLDNECLIIIRPDGQMYPAESFTKKTYAFVENIYTDIVVDEFKLNTSLKESEVIHLQLNDERITSIVNGVFETYSELIAYSKKTYKRSNARRGILEIPAKTSERDIDKQTEEKLMNERFKRFFDAENGAVLPLSNGYKYTDLATQGYKQGSDSRDIKALIDDMFYFTAIAFKIPPSLFLGTGADTSSAMISYINLCINPLADLIASEVNRKMYRKDAYLAGNFLKIDTTRIKLTDIKDLANAMDILFRAGVHTINDNRELIGKEKSADEIADEVFVTKNYMRAADIQKGGES